ncbi:unnamed protein product [Amoebophrya sp. A25]|nr:unnamed protein product [Amoebophrya sp. A25]|eukprot:GSA25T00008775001.1
MLRKFPARRRSDGARPNNKPSRDARRPRGLRGAIGSLQSLFEREEETSRDPPFRKEETYLAPSPEVMLNSSYDGLTSSSCTTTTTGTTMNLAAAGGTIGAVGGPAGFGDGTTGSIVGPPPLPPRVGAGGNVINFRRGADLPHARPQLPPVFEETPVGEGLNHVDDRASGNNPINGRHGSPPRTSRSNRSASHSPERGTGDRSSGKNSSSRPSSSKREGGGRSSRTKRDSSRQDYSESPDHLHGERRRKRRHSEESSRESGNNKREHSRRTSGERRPSSSSSSSRGMQNMVGNGANLILASVDMVGDEQVGAPGASITQPIISEEGEEAFVPEGQYVYDESPATQEPSKGDEESTSSRTSENKKDDDATSSLPEDVASALEASTREAVPLPALVGGLESEDLSRPGSAISRTSSNAPRQQSRLMAPSAAARIKIAEMFQKTYGYGANQIAPTVVPPTPRTGPGVPEEEMGKDPTTRATTVCVLDASTWSVNTAGDHRSAPAAGGPASPRGAAQKPHDHTSDLPPHTPRSEGTETSEARRRARQGGGNKHMDASSHKVAGAAAEGGDQLHQGGGHHVRVAQATHRAPGGQRLSAKDAKNKSSLSYRLITSRRFEIFIGFFIGLNALWMGIEYQMPIEFVNEHFIYFQIADLAFLIIFFLELSARVHVFGIKMVLSQPIYALDAFIVITGVAIEVALPLSVGGFLSGKTLDEGDEGLRLLRSARSLRALRILRVITLIENLWGVVELFFFSLPPLFWTVLFILIIIYLFTIFSIVLLGRSNMGSDPTILEAQANFDRTANTFLSIFQIMTLDGWSDLTKPFFEAHPWTYVWFLLIIAVTAFAMMNLITVSVLETAREAQAKNKEHEDIRQKMEAIQDLYDFPGEGNELTTKEYFMSHWKHSKTFKSVFEQLDLSQDDAGGFFDALDLDGSESLDHFELSTTYMELVRNVLNTPSLVALIRSAPDPKERSDLLKSTMERSQQQRVAEEQKQAIAALQETLDRFQREMFELLPSMVRREMEMHLPRSVNVDDEPSGSGESQNVPSTKGVMKKGTASSMPAVMGGVGQQQGQGGSAQNQKSSGNKSQSKGTIVEVDPSRIIPEGGTVVRSGDITSYVMQGYNPAEAIRKTSARDFVI